MIVNARDRPGVMENQPVLILVCMSDNMDLRDWLAAELEARNWSMRELARRAEISHSWISNVLAGLPPTWDFCAAIAGPLGTSPVEVLLRAGKITPSDIRKVLPVLPDNRATLTERLFAIVEEMSEEEQKALLALLRR